MTTTEDRSELLNRLGLNGQNKAALGAVLGTGRIAEATERADGTMEATIRINPDPNLVHLFDAETGQRLIP